MCTPNNTGGRRWAAHTRPACEAALSRVQAAQTPPLRMSAQVDGVADIARHAATSRGRQELQALQAASENNNDIAMAAYLQSCLIVGNEMRRTYDAVQAALASRQRGRSDRA